MIEKKQEDPYHRNTLESIQGKQEGCILWETFMRYDLQLQQKHTIISYLKKNSTHRS